MALRARRAGKKKAHTGVAVWAFTLSRYRAGGLLLSPKEVITGITGSKIVGSIC